MSHHNRSSCASQSSSLQHSVQYVPCILISQPFSLSKDETILASQNRSLSSLAFPRLSRSGKTVVSNCELIARQVEPPARVTVSRWLDSVPFGSFSICTKYTSSGSLASIDSKLQSHIVWQARSLPKKSRSTARHLRLPLHERWDRGERTRQVLKVLVTRYHSESARRRREGWCSLPCGRTQGRARTRRGKREANSSCSGSVIFGSQKLWTTVCLEGSHYNVP